MAIRITRVYTRAGDDGTTQLVGGARVPKDCPRVEAYGTVDELNAAVGLARAASAAAGARTEAHRAAQRRLEDMLKRLQNELFDLGSELATPPDAHYEGMYRVGSADVKALEVMIDDCQKDLGPLKSFVLPGGGPVSAFLHQARTVCRRAERVVLRLGRDEDLGPWPLRYLNRFGDLCFVLSRWIAKHSGEPEPLWERGLRSPQRRAPQKR